MARRASRATMVDGVEAVLLDMEAPRSRCRANSSCRARPAPARRSSWPERSSGGPSAAPSRSQRDGLIPGTYLLPYLNRLADLLWVLARAAEQAEAPNATPSRVGGRPQSTRSDARRTASDDPLQETGA